MNILFIAPSLGGGGQEKAGMILCNHLQQFHKVTVVTLTSGSKYNYNYTCPVISLNTPTAKSSYGKAIVLIKRIFTLKKIKKKIKPDISIAFGNGAVIANYLSGGKEKKITSIRQSFSYIKNYRSFANKIQQLFFLRALKSADRIIPVSNEINQELLQLYHIHNNYFVHNGVNIAEIQQQCAEPLENNLQFFFNDQVIIHVARIDLSKRTWEVVKLFTLVKKELPKAKLILAGVIDSSDKMNQKMFDFCIKYLNQHHFKIIDGSKKHSPKEVAAADVLMTGFFENPFSLMYRSSVFVLPSSREGFSNATLEAMACGLPVIISDCDTGPREILINKTLKEEYGILLPTFQQSFEHNRYTINENHLKWKSAIISLLSNAELRGHYKKLSLKRVLDFNVSATLHKWDDVLTCL